MILLPLVFPGSSPRHPTDEGTSLATAACARRKRIGEKRQTILNLSKVFFLLQKHIMNNNQGDQIGQFLVNWATFGGSLRFFERIK